MTIDEVMVEMQEHLDAWRLPDRLISVDNWAAMAGMSYRDFYHLAERCKPHIKLLKEYAQANRTYHAAIHAELLTAGAGHIGVLRPLSEKYSIALKVLREKAKRLGLPTSSKQRLSVEHCVASAKVGMTMRELAAAAGYKLYSLRNLVTRGSFEGRLEFTTRRVKHPCGRVTVNTAIARVVKRR